MVSGESASFSPPQSSPIRVFLFWGARSVRSLKAAHSRALQYPPCRRALPKPSTAPQGPPGERLRAPGCDRAGVSGHPRLLTSSLAGSPRVWQGVRLCQGASSACGGRIIAVAGGPALLLPHLASVGNALERGRHFTSQRPQVKHAVLSWFPRQNFVGNSTFSDLPFSDVGFAERRHLWVLFIALTLSGPRLPSWRFVLSVQLHHLQATPPWNSQ
ncbi:hypothetical protein NDU88_003178 [Pleurodeles waltl]|uniref:Uncharacterized protein n=1 Tax=Pleurodeles waltl TaxID=8319 RepID=A0AAV7PD20_PLEWA|nr:hypothetical protein NDU88_003178 [Pleurodeles waltl]